ncbi:MAG: iron-containing alcohol dehydrogenase [Pseudomonadales bacterium]
MPALYKEWFYRAKLALVGGLLSKPQPKPMTFMGPGSSKQLCKAISQFGISDLLVVTDKPLRELGVLDDLLASLDSFGVRATVYDGVLPDPTAQVVNDGIAMLNDNNCKAVLAVGGGSSIDCAKVVALAGGNSCSAEDCIGVNKCKLPALPFFAIPTTAGTGSEATCIAVISDNETHDKGGVIDNGLIPRAAALDPVLMQGLPAHITAATGMDALTHAIESYIGTLGNADTDFYGLASAKLVFENLEEACSNGANMDAREAMALASYYGGLAISQALVGYVHAISHNLGARYGVPHGLGNAMVLPHVLELLKGDAAKKMAEIAVHVGLGEAGESESVLAQKLVDRVWALNKQVGIPATTDVIKDEDIDGLVKVALVEGSGYPTPRYFDEQECRALLERIKAA